MQTSLVQKHSLRKWIFELTAEGVIKKEKAFLNVGSNEKLYSYHDLGVEVEKQANNEGVPTLMIITVMTVLTGIVVVNYLREGNLSALAFSGFIIFYLLVIIHMIQKYISRTYLITGGRETLTLMRYRGSEGQTLEFIKEVKGRTKAALINRYNDLIADIKPTPYFKIEPVSESYKLTDDEFRQLRMKTDHLFSNLFDLLMVRNSEEDEPDKPNDPDRDHLQSVV